MISYLDSKKYFIISLYFFTLFTVGLFTFSDYGISIDEDNTRINGFVSLKYIFEIFRFIFDTIFERDVRRKCRISSENERILLKITTF